MSSFLSIYEQFDGFNKIWYECHAIGIHPKLVICSFLQPAITPPPNNGFLDDIQQQVFTDMHFWYIIL
jgi:hypothetical protein